MKYIEYEFLPTSDVEGEFWSITVDCEKSEITISFWPDSNVDVNWGQRDAIYQMPDKISNVKFNDSYSWIILENGQIFLFKFEENGCLVGDEYEYEEEVPLEDCEFICEYISFDFYND